jgi:hypothetical protein
MSTKLVEFTNPHTNKPVLVNPDHIRTVSEVEVDGYNRVRLLMDAGYHQDVEGELAIVRTKLTSL